MINLETSETQTCLSRLPLPFAPSSAEVRSHLIVAAYFSQTSLVMKGGSVWIKDRESKKAKKEWAKKEWLFTVNEGTQESKMPEEETNLQQWNQRRDENLQEAKQKEQNWNPNDKNEGRKEDDSKNDPATESMKQETIQTKQSGAKSQKTRTAVHQTERYCFEAVPMSAKSKSKELREKQLSLHSFRLPWESPWQLIQNTNTSKREQKQGER